MRKSGKKKVLFLYTELANYSFACFHALVLKGIELHVIRYRVNKEAPFEFPEMNKVHLYDRNALDTSQMDRLIAEIHPDLIVCSGWVDKDYLKICKKYFGKIPTVLALDNQWKGSLRQYIASLVSRAYLLKIFSHCWV